MATIQGLTKDRMLEIEAAAIVSAEVDQTNSHLLLTRHDDAIIDAGLLTVPLSETVLNNTGSTLTKGTVVYVSGANGTNVLVSRSQANAESTSSKTLGFVASDILNGAQGLVITEGLLSGLNTSAATAGDAVWLSPSTAGGVVYGLANKPSAPNHMVYLGVVVRAQTNNGEIYIHIQNGFELDELHDVSITTPVALDVLARNAGNTLWVNSSASELGLAPLANPTFTGHATIPSSISTTEYRLQAAPVLKTSATTLLASEILAGMIQTTPTANFTLTLPSGNNVASAVVAGLPEGGSFEWSITNTAAFTITLAAGSNHTIVGATTTTSTNSSLWRTRRGATSGVYVTYRIA